MSRQILKAQAVGSRMNNYYVVTCNEHGIEIYYQKIEQKEYVLRQLTGAPHIVYSQPDQPKECIITGFTEEQAKAMLDRNFPACQRLVTSYETYKKMGKTPEELYQIAISEQGNEKLVELYLQHAAYGEVTSSAAVASASAPSSKRKADQQVEALPKAKKIKIKEVTCGIVESAHAPVAAAAAEVAAPVIMGRRRRGHLPKRYTPSPLSTSSGYGSSTASGGASDMEQEDLQNKKEKLPMFDGLQLGNNPQVLWGSLSSQADVVAISDKDQQLINQLLPRVVTISDGTLENLLEDDEDDLLMLFSHH